MECLQCRSIITGEPYTKKLHIYFGTISYRTGYDGHFCSPEHYQEWWDEITWHLDCIDERMNSNVNFERIEGHKGRYRGKDADARWNGLEARHFLGEYEFKHRKEHPKSCKSCMFS